MMMEACISLTDIYRRLIDLEEEREMFRLANDETMNEWLFAKKMREYDEKLTKLQAAYDEEETWYEDLISGYCEIYFGEALNSEDDLEEDPIHEEITSIFEELSPLPFF